jgi:carbamoyltransferase
MSAQYKLSVYFGFHDSGISFAKGDQVVLHLEAERYFRRKHMRFNTREELFELVQAGMEYLGITIADVETLYLSKWHNLFEGESKVTIQNKVFEPVLTGHHCNHIGAVIPSGHKKMIVVCADGGSEDGCSKIYLLDNGELTILADLDETIMSGKFYGTLTQMIIDPHCSKAHNHYPGKTMGLAALGHFDLGLQSLLEKHSAEMSKLHFDGCEHLNKAFGVSLDYKEPWNDERRRDLAYTGQEFWVDRFEKTILGYKDKADYLALTGGCALNVVLNTRLQQSGAFKDVYVGPVSNDSGQSLGALLYENQDLICNFPYLGRSFGDVDKLPKKLVQDLLDHKIIAWYQGASEVGSRALGHRSFIGLPDSHEMKRRLSIDIKKREAYRPVAPIIADFALDTYFKDAKASPYMTFNYEATELCQKLAPAIVHDDGTSRIQTLSETDNPVLYAALVELDKRGLPPIIMNSSFNVADEPIVDSPEDAHRQFKVSGADVMYINGERFEQAAVDQGVRHEQAR